MIMIIKTHKSVFILKKVIIQVLNVVKFSFGFAYFDRTDINTHELKLILIHKLEAVVKFSDYFKSRKKSFARCINAVTYIYMCVGWRLIKKIPEIFTSSKNQEP